MASIGPHTLKLPRLRVRERLLQECPEAAGLLGIQERLVGFAAPPGLSAKSPQAPPMSNMSAAGRSLLAGSLLDEEISPEELVKQEMSAVKAERARLIEQLTLVKTDPGKAGGDLQQEDIMNLRREVEVKKAKLNELHEELLVEEKLVTKLNLESQDCTRLMPDGCPEAQARLNQLRSEQDAISIESAEAGAKHRLYTLLEARTKKELQAMANKVTIAQNLQYAFAEDEAAMLIYVHAMNAALQDALKEKQGATQHLESTREDWALKLQSRHKEVRELQRRQQEDGAREERRLKAIADQEAAEQEKKAQWMLQEEAFASSLQAIQPKVDALEEAWSRLHTITGADTPEQLIKYWQGLKVQEEEMLKLASLAEARQVETKQEVEALLARRSQLLEDEGTVDLVSKQLPPSGGNNGKISEELEEAKRRSQVAQKHFYEFRDVCVSAQQGLVAMLSRIEAALERVDTVATSPIRRRSSSLSGTKQKSMMRQSTMTKSGHRQSTASKGMLRQSTLTKSDSVAKSLALPAGPKLQRLYTIDQDAFFPDLPMLISNTAASLQSLMLVASKANEAQENGSTVPALPSSPARRQSLFAEDPRRHPLAGAPWVVTYDNLQDASLNKKGVEAKVDLTRLVGYLEEPQKVVEPRASFEDDDENNSWDGVVTRQLLKNRAAKVVQKHKATAVVKA